MLKAMSKFQGVLKMFILGMLKTILKTVLKYEKNTITLYGTCWNWAADFVFLLRFCTRKRSETYVSTRKYSSRMGAARISGSGGRHRWRQTLPGRQIHLEAEPPGQTPLGSRPPLEADPPQAGGVWLHFEIDMEIWFSNYVRSGHNQLQRQQATGKLWLENLFRERRRLPLTRVVSLTSWF